MTEVDLHLHTTFSDGRLNPSEIVRLCASRGLRVISITDHDSTEGLSEAMEEARSFPGLTVIPGIELSTDIPGSEIHILGYFVDHMDSNFQRVLLRFREGRQDRAQKMVERLKKLGLKISWDRVVELSDGGAIGRPHIAQAMVEKGYVEYPRDAFDKYIGRTGPAYIGREKFTPVEAVKLLLTNGALPVMAHPTYSVAKSDRVGIASLRQTLHELKVEGLVGMEVYYCDYTPQQVDYLAKLADENGLISCGGSDYHASGNPGEPEPGMVGPPIRTVEALKAIKNKL